MATPLNAQESANPLGSNRSASTVSDIVSLVDDETQHQEADAVYHITTNRPADALTGSEDRQESIQRYQTNKSVLSNHSLHATKRRGLLARFAFLPEFKDARDYPASIKLSIVVIIALASIVGPMGTSIILPAINDMTTELNTTTLRVNIAVGIYLLSLGVFPLWWSSFSEYFGRRSVYVSSFTLLIAFSLACALAPNINCLIGFRVLAGACSASVQSVGAGTISDLYKPEERGKALGLYYLGPLMAPLLSPIIGSLLLIRWSWRSTQWFIVILSAVIDLCIIFLLPETLRKQENTELIKEILLDRRKHRNKFGIVEPKDVESSHSLEAQADDELEEMEQEETAETLERIERIATRVSQRSTYFDEQKDAAVAAAATESESPENNQTLTKRISANISFFLLRPMRALYFLQCPPVSLAISFSAISFGILYFVNMTIEYEYSRSPYNWKSLYVGFAYIPNSVTYIFASIYGGKWTDYLLRRYKESHNGFYAPEARLSYNILSAIVSFPIALMIIGWCFNYHTFWVFPLIGTGLFGYASMMTIGPTITYLVDSLPGRGATGVALNNLIRQILATIAVFIVEPLIKALGVGVLFSILTGIILVSSSALLVIKWRGDHWRENFDLLELYEKTT
ncbi:hypothetical protein WICPIJ_009197 [Wickerhamomyces pijperi]|uniref:Major facilitator superfamily (MFS) profile domain-containing protein n=1 Tax=Wickerhamomyces pijperi TaxID=599730 RepID=A0A9P8PQJ0_WICPI|nr:hypothetical protein WICPIJ_009197 [Wickerhamomyces pijperi]